MKLTPIGVKKLGLRNADYIAQKRLARTLRLNCTEAVALIATQILEFVGDGSKTVAELMDLGKQLFLEGDMFFQQFLTFWIVYRLKDHFLMERSWSPFMMQLLVKMEI